MRLLELLIADRLRAYQAAGVIFPAALAALLARDVIELVHEDR